ncbi:MAG: SUMF1/EgtB/PvdO family nonheme iron enzyme [Kiritimatiellae bacterium]|nr:SUMF1/EgtB/PvdO family nonheme iron enzyme [Kiritimatiellia bacterium]
MNLKQMTLAAALGLAATSALAAPTINVTAAQQRYPWNNIVDVTYTLTGCGNDSSTYAVVLTTTIGGAEVELSNGAEPSVDGTHTVACALPSDLQAKNCKITGKVYAMANCTPDTGTDGVAEYMIVNLATKKTTFEKKLSYQTLSNKRYNTTDYKTKYIVFRLVPKGTYKIGDDVNYASANPRRDCNVNNAYYLTMYPVTSAQYANVMGNVTTYTDTSATNNLSISTFRGGNTLDANGTSLLSNSQKPTDASFVGKVKAMITDSHTNNWFDMPNDNMWEVAARAGATTVYYWGDNWNNEFGSAISGDLYPGYAKAHPVGMRRPNAWGFYDMSGNVFTYVMGKTAGSTSATSNQPTDALNIFSSGSYWTMRGGSWNINAPSARLSCRSNYTNGIGGAYASSGFRLARIVQ